MIKETIDKYLPNDEKIRQEIIEAQAYQNIIRRVSTIEDFASNNDFPNINKMIENSIAYHADRLGMPQVVSYKLQKEHGYKSNILLISQLGKILPEEERAKKCNMFGIKTYPWFNVEIIGEPTKNFQRGPVIKIRKSNSGKSLKGLIFSGYNVSYPLVREVAQEFNPILYSNRNDAILQYAEIHDRINGTDSTRKYAIETIADGKRPYMGIDEKTIRILNKEINGNRILGVIHHYNSNWTDSAINILIERIDYKKRL